jgi:hypothetical protein
VGAVAVRRGAITREVALTAQQASPSLIRHASCDRGLPADEVPMEGCLSRTRRQAVREEAFLNGVGLGFVYSDRHGQQHGGPFPMETTYTWESNADGTTRMTLRNRGTPSGFSVWVALLMAMAMRRANRKDLALLKNSWKGSTRDPPMRHPTSGHRQNT